MSVCHRRGQSCLSRMFLGLGALLLLLVGVQSTEAWASLQNDWKQFQQADAIVEGKVSKIVSHTTLEVYPPIHVIRFQLSGYRVLKGKLPPGFVLNWSTRKYKQLPKVGARLLFTVRVTQQTLKERKQWYRVLAHSAVTSSLVKLAQKAAKTPITWKKIYRKTVGKDIQLRVEQVKPGWQHRWVNPYGDGKFRLTLSNPTYKPVTIPAIKAIGEGHQRKIYWKRAILVLHEGQLQPLPNREAIPASAKPLVLKGGESVSVVVDMLPLGCKHCPGGGRMGYTFFVGEKSVSSFFYYSYTFHRKLAKLNK